MRLVEEEYKMTNFKSAIKLYGNENFTMRQVRAFEENAALQCHQSLVKEARTFAEELGFTLDLSFPHPKCRDNTDGADLPIDKIKRHQLNQRGCFAWLKNRDTAPTHTIAGMLELYEQLTLTKVYDACKTQTNHPNDIFCRLLWKNGRKYPSRAGELFCACAE